ncbi:MAG: bifunctional adenosylcobinamide kinase/adenosylcobinamide-phosphate guanylyltransferase [Rhodobacteraceae bacterium]|nr:bifunctional adenosylcobinamide kinase/adenosylcobinamide-phosphate guanylyltransferase [Paracoccaceae bacterium]
MGKSVLITGGARSGKSAFAERMTLGLTGRATYIATAEAFDDEMAERISLHQARRGAEWTNLHAPLELCTALRDSDAQPRLVDCLTLWLSNMMLADRDWRTEVLALAALLPDLRASVVCVTNEVGAGIVPENALARRFRDAAGWMNQTIAAGSDEVFLTVSGYPIKVKPNDHLS